MCKNSLLSLLLSLTNVNRVNLFYKQFYYSRLKSALPHRVFVWRFPAIPFALQIPRLIQHAGVKVTLLYAFLLNEWQINSIRVIFKWKRNNKNSTSNARGEIKYRVPWFPVILNQSHESYRLVSLSIHHHNQPPPIWIHSRGVKWTDTPVAHLLILCTYHPWVLIYCCGNIPSTFTFFCVYVPCW